MSKFFVGFLNADELAALHNAGHAVKAFVVSEPARLVATLAETSIGATVKADIEDMMNKSLPGAEKFAQVLGRTLPLVEKYVAAPGTIISDAGAVARLLIQTLYTDAVGAVKAAVAPAAPVAPVAPPMPSEAIAHPVPNSPLSVAA